jgi:hydroxyquinol 1,2-dioxygenase
VLGPFFVEAAPEKQNRDNLSGNMLGDPLIVTGSVSTIDGRPLAGAVVDVWHSDHDGYYDVQQLDEIGDLAMRGRFHCSQNQ